MKDHPSSIKKGPEETLDNPNDDGCVLGTAARDEDPNKTTDWGKENKLPGNRQTPKEARGMPGYPREAVDDLSLPPNGEAEPGIETPEQNNDKG